MASKVTTLYEDSAKTEALYPRTKVSAVSDNNGNGLEALLNAKQNLLVSGTNIKTIDGNSILGAGDMTVGLASMDVSNILLDWQTNNFQSYIATEDCWLCKIHDYDGGGASEVWKIDGVQIIQGKTPFIAPLKKGQTITLTGSSAVMWIKAFGIKR